MDTETGNSYPKISAAIRRAETAFPEYMAKHFTRVLQKIELCWGEPEALPLFDSLLLDTREGRQGFPREAVSEITLLKQVHDYFSPSFEFNPYDPFSGSGVLVPPAKTAPRTAPKAPESTGEEVRAEATQPTGAWPLAHTQRDLIDLLQLRNSGKNIYPVQGRPVGEIFVHYGFTDKRTLDILQNSQKRPSHKKTRLGEILMDIGIIHQDDLEYALCVQTGIIMVDIINISIPNETTKLVPLDNAREKQAIPVCVHNGTLLLAVSDPSDFTDKSFFTMLTKLKVEPVYAPRHEIVTRLNAYGTSKDSQRARDEFRDLAQKAAADTLPILPDYESSVGSESNFSENDSTIINLVNRMIISAIDEKASDIHIELFQGSEESNIRFRRDGNMESFSSFPKTYHAAVISRIKIMSGLDISERRRPQDGKISFGLQDGRRIDLRISIIPTARGTEFITIRILASGEPLPLAALGMDTRDMEAFREASRHTFGLILVCGPTGSGKTTTLHSVIKELNTNERKIWTVEDPVEIVQPRLCQVQVNTKIGLTFASVLRALLRADPDIVMIGEMRDQETSKIALEASMTGHLVLSTLHTNSASETVARLLDMEVDPFNLSDALLAILAQRLARKLCPQCARREEAPVSELEELANEYFQSARDKLPARSEREAIIGDWRKTFGEDGRLYLKRAVGCKECSGGYKGRIGLYELLQITPQIRHLIRQQVSAAEYKVMGASEGMKTLKQDGIEKILRGITDLAQVHSACA
jgi:type II secretory ATPase GspE/PulE/Tfp pilus assembly ATPase PilB-like protein